MPWNAPGWIPKGEVKMDDVMTPMEKVVAAIPYRDYVLVITDIGGVFKVWEDGGTRYSVECALPLARVDGSECQVFEDRENAP